MGLAATYESNDTGDVKTITSNQLAQHMQEAGYNVTMSPDGNTFYQTVNGQEMEGGFKDLLESNYGKVKGIKPHSPDESTVSPYLRLKLEALPNDNETRRAFLRSHLANQEGQDVGLNQITGSGDDWYYFNTKNGKHYALTNKEGLDLSDITGLVPSVSRGIASGAAGIVAGGSGLTAGGVGAIPAGIAGSIAGGKAGSAIGQKLMSYADEDFKKALGDYEGRTTFKERLGEDVGNIAGDALSGALGPTLKALKGFGGVTGELSGLANSVVNASPVSQAAKGIGGIVGPAGNFVGQGAGYVADSPRIKQALVSLATAGKLDTLQIAKLPIALKNFIKPYLAKGAEAVGEEGIAQTLKTPATPFVRKSVGIGEKVAQKLGGVTKSQSQDIYNTVRPDEVTNFYAKGYDKAASALKSMKEALSPDMRAGYGTPGPKTPRMFAEEAKAAVNQNKMAYKFGKTIGNTTAVGEGLEKGVLGAAQIGLRGAEAGGKTVGTLGHGLNQLGHAAAPVEGRVLQKKAFDAAAENNNSQNPISNLLDALKMNLKKRNMVSQFDQ